MVSKSLTRGNVQRAIVFLSVALLSLVTILPTIELILRFWLGRASKSKAILDLEDDIEFGSKSGRNVQK
jgi:hypothetical protein